jgi:outer membrane autotransporter protein
MKKYIRCLFLSKGMGIMRSRNDRQYRQLRRNVMLVLASLFVFGGSSTVCAGENRFSVTSGDKTVRGDCFDFTGTNKPAISISGSGATGLIESLNGGISATNNWSGSKSNDASTSSAIVASNGGNLKLQADQGDISVTGPYGMHAESGASITLEAVEGNNVIKGYTNAVSAFMEYPYQKGRGTVTIQNELGDNEISASYDGDLYANYVEFGNSPFYDMHGNGIYADFLLGPRYLESVHADLGEATDISVVAGHNNKITGTQTAIRSRYLNINVAAGGETDAEGKLAGVSTLGGKIEIHSNRNVIHGSGVELMSYITGTKTPETGYGIEAASDYYQTSQHNICEQEGLVNVQASGDNDIYGYTYGVYSHESNANVNVESSSGVNKISGGEAGAKASEGGRIQISGTTQVTGGNGTGTALAASHPIAPYLDLNIWVPSGAKSHDFGMEDWDDNVWDDDGDAAPASRNVRKAAAVKSTALRRSPANQNTETNQLVYPSIDLQYGAGSEVKGSVEALDGGTITISPQTKGTIAIYGNIASYTPYKEYSKWRETYYNEKYYFKDMLPDYPEKAAVNLTLSNGSTLTGTVDTGLMYAENSANNAVLIEDSDEAVSYKEAPEGAVLLGDVNLELNDTSVWNMTGPSAVTKLGGSGGTVAFVHGGHGLQIDELEGSHTFAMDLSMNGADSDMLYIREGASDEQTLKVKNSAALNQEMQSGDVVRFAVVSSSYDGFRNNKVYVPDGITNATLSVQYRSVASDPLNTQAYNDSYNGDGTNKPTTAEVQASYIDGYDDPQYVYLVKQDEEVITSDEQSHEYINDGAKTPGRARNIIWRYVTDLDTFTNRTGEAQYFTPGADQGGWVRLRYRNFGVDGTGEVDGNTYEIGYTTVVKDTDEEKHRFSVSGAYGKETGHFEGYGGSLEVRDASFNLYDTHEYFPAAEEMAAKPAWKKGTHSYWDTYLKYHHVKTDYSAVDHQTEARYDGNYDQDIISLSTEYGRENKLSDKWSIVPQAQLQLSYVGGYDYYDSQDLHVDADHDWSLIGRLGFDLVRELDPKLDSKLYFKASVLHEFLDGSDVTVSANGDYYNDNGDLSGTWGVLGLGYSAKIGEQQYMYLDAERYFGNDFARTYSIRAGVNWKF